MAAADSQMHWPWCVISRDCRLRIKDLALPTEKKKAAGCVEGYSREFDSDDDVSDGSRFDDSDFDWSSSGCALALGMSPIAFIH